MVAELARVQRTNIRIQILANSATRMLNGGGCACPDEADPTLRLYIVRNRLSSSSSASTPVLNPLGKESLGRPFFTVAEQF